MDTFARIKGPDISTRFVGMEITDHVHWAKVFAADGTYLSYFMLRKASSKWRVENDKLCLDRDKPKGDDWCFEVWMSGPDVQLRLPEMHFTIEGMLQKPIKRGP